MDRMQEMQFGGELRLLAFAANFPRLLCQPAAREFAYSSFKSRKKIGCRISIGQCEE
jgi:hypothetical protein